MSFKCEFCNMDAHYLHGTRKFCRIHWRIFGIASDYQDPNKYEIKPFQDVVNDPVNRPSHYTDGGIETIDFIDAKRLNFELGNAVKYIARAGKKDPGKKVEDLRKAIWYIEREIKNHAG